jgi:hypothetical protein
MVEQPGPGRDGWPEKKLAQRMIDAGAEIAINLDNSGSSQFLFTPDGRTPTVSKKGDKLLEDMGDMKSGAEVYRPVPNFPGIIDKPK